MEVSEMAKLHRALGDEVRLRIVDELLLADHTPAELGEIVGLRSNLIAHHLGVLEQSGLVLRHRGEGDRRKRYVSLHHTLLENIVPSTGISVRSVLFVCTHNSARSQFAEAAFKARVDLVVQSAGTMPAVTLHPKALSAASEMGIELAAGYPKPYEAVRGAPDLVVTVCDRAREEPLPFTARNLHWSVPDPVEIDRLDAFRTAFGAITERVDRLVTAIQGGTNS